jgi:hypothetical protein
LTTDPQGRLATRSELFSVTSGICALLLLPITVSMVDDRWMDLYAIFAAFGASLYFGMKARWANSPDPRRAELAAILDSVRSDRLTLSTEESREQQLKLIADLQSQLVQLRKRVEGF